LPTSISAQCGVNMSRIGKVPVALPKGVDASVSGNKISIKGPKAEKPLTWDFPAGIKVAVDKSANQIVVTRTGEGRQDRALHGLTRALINNMVKGVELGYEKKLEIHGVGYDAELKGKVLVLKVGFANPVERPIPDGVKVTVQAVSQGGNRIIHITIQGCDKQVVGEFAAGTRAVRPPEPYKQKGIRYNDETIRKKAGKAFAGGGAG